MGVWHPRPQITESPSAENAQDLHRASMEGLPPQSAASRLCHGGSWAQEGRGWPTILEPEPQPQPQPASGSWPLAQGCLTFLVAVLGPPFPGAELKIFLGAQGATAQRAGHRLKGVTCLLLPPARRSLGTQAGREVGGGLLSNPLGGRGAFTLFPHLLGLPPAPPCPAPSPRASPPFFTLL